MASLVSSEHINYLYSYYLLVQVCPVSSAECRVCVCVCVSVCTHVCVHVLRTFTSCGKKKKTGV